MPTDLGDYAWYSSNAGDHTYPAGVKKPNPWGLYDMHGNVWEWCADYYDQDYYAKSPIKDPHNEDSGACRILRGGSMLVAPSLCRSAVRHDSVPDFCWDDDGFRVVLRVPARTP